MASIPLRCSICPKEPDFSDVSHLLTHVSSKGHLSHYFKAQVRARQDENVRHKLDIYDRWYNKHQIEKLLSQRMSAKHPKPEEDAKFSTRKQASANASKGRKSRARRPSKKVDASQDEPSPVKRGRLIDPQLSINAMQAASQDPLQVTPHHPVGSYHPIAPIPPMLDWPKETPKPHRRSSSLPPYQRTTPRTYADSHALYDPEGDWVRTFMKSPGAAAYAEQPRPSFNPSKSHKGDRALEYDDPGNRSPILKGIKYPGMSLFDAASREEQRLRNQKKQGSILEQMEVNSAAIEPMEHIYWPEGRLKKKRLITGNVESSPLKDATPPAPRPTRAKPSRVLTDIISNVPVTRAKRGRKPATSRDRVGVRMEGMADKALQALRSAYPRGAYVNYDPLGDSEDETGLGSPRPLTHRESSFSVFRDPPVKETQGPVDTTQSSDTTTLALPSTSSSDAETSPSVPQAGHPSTRPIQQSAAAPYTRLCGPGFHQHFSQYRGFSGLDVDEDKENVDVATLQRPTEMDDMIAEQPQPVTQRYFSMVGNQLPQFYSSMPPQMDFGGMAGYAFHGTVANPFNAFYHGHYQQPEFSSAEYSPPSLVASARKSPSRAMRFEEDA